MAVARVALGAGNQATGSSTTLAVSTTCNTSTTGTSTFAVAGVVQCISTNSSATTATCTYGGVSMTKLGSTFQVGSSTSRAAITVFYLANPATGSQTVTATSGSGGTVTAIGLQVAVYSGVQSVGTAVTAAALTIAATAATTGVDMNFCVCSNGADITATNQTQLYDAFSSQTGVGDAINVSESSTGSTTFTCTGTSTTPGIVAVPIFGTSAAPRFAAAGARLAGATSTAANLPVPAGVTGASGELVVACLNVTAGSITVTPPDGTWTAAGSSPINKSGGQGFSSCVFYKRPTAADTGTYNFTMGSAWREGAAVLYTGVVASGDPFDATTSALAGTDTGTAAPATSVTTTDADRLLTWFGFSWNGGGTITYPTGFDVRATWNVDAAWVVAGEPQAAAGASGSVTATWGAAGATGAWLGALKPPATGARSAAGDFFAWN